MYVTHTFIHFGYYHHSIASHSIEELKTLNSLLGGCLGVPHLPDWASFLTNRGSAYEERGKKERKKRGREGGRDSRRGCRERKGR